MAETLTEKFEETARIFSEKICMAVKGEDEVQRLTYGQIHDFSLKVAGWLLEQGIQKGDRVALALENSPEWCMSYFGLLFAGAVAVPLDVELSPDEIRYFLDETGAKVLFASEKLSLEELIGLSSLKKIVVLTERDITLENVIRFSDVLESSPASLALPRAEPEDLASIIYTSGTTGLPKGVMLTHKNFYSNFLSITKLNAVRPTDNFLSILPLHHSFPFVATLLVPLFSGVKITYIKTLKPELILRCLKEEKITILAVAPQVLQHFYNGMDRRIKEAPFGLGFLIHLILNLSWRLSRVIQINPARPLLSRIKSSLGSQFRFFVCGGAKLDKGLERNFYKLGFKVLVGYGLTEASPVVSMNPLESPKIGSSGRALPDVEIRILDKNEEGVGEIAVRGDNIMKGYYKDEEATRETIKEGWLHTGDLGYIDRKGYLFIRERVKEIIVLSSGKNISPEEVEKLYQEASSIKELCVLPDSREEKLVAVIVPDFSYLREMGESDIHGRIKWDMENISEKLVPYKRVRGFVLANNDLPKTRLGKIKRHEAQSIYEEKSKGVEKKALAIEESVSEAGKSVMDVLTRQTGIREISQNSHLELDLGIDSLGKVELMAGLEKEFGISLKEEEFLRLFTVRELIEHTEENLQKEKRETKKEELSWSNILGAEPCETLLDKISVRPTITAYFPVLLASLILDPLLRIFFRLKVSGRENLRGEGFIICPNHTSFLDGFVIFSSLPLHLRVHLFFIGYREYFELPIIRNLVKLMRVIPLDASRNLVEAMQLSAFVLKSKKILCIFPEGARSISGEIKEFKKGTSILSEELGVRIVPACISGTNRALKPGTWLPRPCAVRVVFGRKLSAEELKEKGKERDKDAEDYRAVSLGLREEVIRLKKEIEA